MASLLNVRVEPLGFVPLRRRLAAYTIVAIGVVCALIAPLVASGAPLDRVLSGYAARVSSATGFAELMKYSVAMMFTGLAGIVAFRSRVWNIGLEGYMIIGAVATAAAAYAGLGLVGEAFAAFAAGVAWGAVVALFYLLGVSEIVASMMLYYVSLYVLLFALYRLWPSSYGLFPQTPPWEPRLPVYHGIPSTLILAIALVAAAEVLYRFSVGGLVARTAGINERAVLVAGYSIRLVRVATLLLSSGLAALAGFHVAASTGYLNRGYASLGYGFAGITVAFLASLEPWLVPLAALLMGLVYHFGVYTSAYIPGSLATYFPYAQGVILLGVVLAKTLPRYRFVRVR